MIYLATSYWTFPSTFMYLQSDAAKWQHIDFLYPWDLFSPDPWISKGWKNTMSPFFINKSILFVSLNFSYSLIPKYALFTIPFQSGYSWSKNFPLCDFGIIFKAPFYFVAFYKEAQAATILSAGPNGKYARSWCIGCRELPPIPGGLLMNMVWTDFMFSPQKLFK